MSSNIIFEKSIGAGVKKIAQNYSGVVILLEDGTLQQHSGYGPTYRVPPDLLGNRIVDMVENSRSGEVDLLLSDGSKLTGGQNIEWMETHGYKSMPSTDYAFTPSGAVYRWTSTSSTNHRPRSRNSIDHAWVKCADFDPGRVKKVVSCTFYGNGSSERLYALTSDGAVEPFLSGDTKNGEEPMIDAPWAEEEWRFKDILGGSNTLHAITTDGQVVTTMIGRHMCPEAVFPLPESNAVRFLKGANFPSVMLESGEVVFYSNRSDWKGDTYHHCQNDRLGPGQRLSCTPYIEHIVGAKAGPWLELAGTMIALGRTHGVERCAPHNLRARAVVKTMKALGNI